VASAIDEALQTGKGLEEVDGMSSLITRDSEGVVSGNIDGTPFAEVQDMLRLAQTKSLSGEQLVQEFKKHSDLVGVVQVAREFNKTFAGYQITSSGAWVGFVGKVPEKVASIAAKVPGVILQGDMSFTYPELINYQVLATDALAKGLGGNSTAWADARTSTIEIRIADDVTKANIIVQQVVQPKNLTLLPTFNIERVTDPAGSTVAMRGGGLLNGNVYCTAGFTIQGSGGTERLSTAGHCERELTGGATYVSHSVDGSATTHVAPGWRSEGASGDSGYMTPGTMDPVPVFYYDWNLKRYVTDSASYSQINEGDGVCHFGRTTGASCSTVLHVDVTLTFDGIAHQYEVKMADRIDAAGDSGGPWYWGSVAFGIHSGYSASGCGYAYVQPCSVWSPIWLLNDNNLYVLEQ
jgi:hypothetical protein